MCSLRATEGLYQNGPWTKTAQCQCQQESHAVARKLCDAAAVLFSLKFADNIHYKIKSSQASKTRLSGGPFWSHRKFMGRFGRFPLQTTFSTDQNTDWMSDWLIDRVILWSFLLAKSSLQTFQYLLTNFPDLVCKPDYHTIDDILQKDTKNACLFTKMKKQVTAIHSKSFVDQLANSGKDWKLAMKWLCVSSGNWKNKYERYYGPVRRLLAYLL